MGYLIYDLEIVKAIPDHKKPNEPGIEYCAGWDDHANMGVSVICAYDTEEAQFRVFTQERFWEFEALTKERILVGFNSIHFDDRVLRHVGINVDTQYDILREMWVAAGLRRDFQYPGHAGFSLDATVKANGLGSKTGWGGYAPVRWQRGEFGSVIDYCLEDVRLTWKLFEMVRRRGSLRDPRDPAHWLYFDEDVPV